MVNDVWLCLFQVEIPHLCLDVIFDEVDDVAKIVIQATWADQLLHLTAFMAAGYLADQPEHDTLCCEGAQTCKQCKCPKTLLHEARTMFPPRRGQEVEAAVRRAFAGMLPGERGLPVRPPLFEQRLDPSSKRLRWYPTRACTVTLYEECRKSLGGVHLIANALWRLPFYDYLAQAFKDTMHGQEHGVQVNMLKSTVKEIQILEIKLKTAAGVLKRRLFSRLLRLCDSASVQHMTLLTLGNQKILDGVEKWGSNAKGQGKEAPLVDAMDVQMLMLAMPFVMDGLAEKELTKFNAGKRRQDQVADPCRPIIGAFNDYLQWYSMYRSRKLPETQVQDMDEKGVTLLETLQRVFPHFVTTTRKDGTVVRRSKWCTEKPHSIKHGGSNYRTAGRCRNYSVQPLETQHKYAVKAVAHKTNNQAAVGKSILESNIQREASVSLASQIDRTGM